MDCQTAGLEAVQEDCRTETRIHRDLSTDEAKCRFSARVERQPTASKTAQVVWQDLEEVVDILTLTHARRREFYDKYNGMKKSATPTGGKIFAPAKYGILAHYEKIMEIMA